VARAYLQIASKLVSGTGGVAGPDGPEPESQTQASMSPSLTARALAPLGL